MLENYQANRERLTNVVKSFANLALERERKVELARLVEVEQEIFSTLSDADAEKQRIAQAVASFAELSELAQSIMIRSSDLIDAEIEAFCPNVMYYRHLSAMQRHAVKRSLTDT